MRPYNNKPDYGRTEKRENDRLLYGIHAVRAAFHNPDRVIRQIWTTENAFKQIQEDLDEKRHPIPITMERKEIDRKLPAHTVHQGLVIEAEPLEEIFLSDLTVKATQADDMTIVILDQVTDPHNVGGDLTVYVGIWRITYGGSQKTRATDHWNGRKNCHWRR